MKEWMTEQGSNVRYGLCSSQRCRPASRQQQSHGTCLIIMESIKKQKLTSGRKIVGSVTESLISILCCPSLWAVHWSPPTQKWRMGRNARRAAARQTGDVESRGRQLHKDRHGAGGGVWGVTVKSVWGNWVQVHRQKIDCVMMWWRQITELSTPSCLGLPVTAGKNWRILRTVMEQN